MTQLQNVRPVAGQLSAVPRPRNLQNVEVWKHHSRNELAARLGKAKRAGEVRPIGGIELNRRREASVVVYRIKPHRSRAPWVVLGSLFSLTTIGGVAWMIWSIFDLLVYAAGFVAVTGLALFLLTRISHSGGCVGIHCKGCRGGK